MQAIPILNLNTNPSTFKDGEARDARNIVLTKDLKAARNESGFSLLHESDGNIIGRIELPNGFILFSTNPDKIVYIENDAVIKTISSSYFNFNIDHPIDGNYTFNSDGDLIITFSEGVNGNNETRILNITKSPTTLSKSQIERINIIPDVIYPNMIGYSWENGSMLAGSYQAAVAYKVDDAIYSNYSILGDPIYVVGEDNEHTKIGDTVNRHILFNFTNLDTRYEKFKIGILYKGLDDFEKTFETEDIETNVAYYKIYNTTSLNAISIDDLTVPSVSYIKDEASTIFMGRTYRGNVKTIDYNGLETVMTNIANNVKVSLSQYDAGMNPYGWTNGFVAKHFKEGEYYVLYIGAIDYKGNMVNAYPIPCKTGDDTIPINASSSNTFKIHKIPYIDSVTKKLHKLSCTLPNNINSYLGSKFTNVITSFCYFYAKHDFYNSKILAQGVSVPDYIVNDFNDNQAYHQSFNSRSKFRFYSLEHLFLKNNISNFHINRSKVFNYISTSDIVSNSNDIHAAIIYGSPVLSSHDVISVSSAKYIRNDNIVDSNIAGESYHRLYVDEFAANQIIGYNTEYAFDDINIRRIKPSIHDLESNSDDLYNDLYSQNLIICSPIVYKTDNSNVRLSGDFFFDNFTFRITGPVQYYKYGTNDMDLQGEDYVYKCIISINLESRFNIKSRFSGSGDYQRVFTINNIGDTQIKEFLKVPYSNDNFINTAEGKGYDLNSHYPGYDYNIYEKELDTKYHFSNRVIRSVVDSTESRGIPWRIFKANDYKDLSLNRGEITALQSDERNVYIQQLYSLAIASLRDKLSNSDQGESYLGSSDVFDREPIEILFEKTGYIGCDSRFATLISPFGYVVVDTSKKNIFLVKGATPKRLTDMRVEEWFNLNLSKVTPNPYKDNGIVLLYDDEIKSLFVTQIGLNPFTIHYNFPRDGFVSFHEYIPNMYIASRVSSYCISVNTVYKRYASNKATYFNGNTYKSSVTFIYNVEPETYKQLLGLMFNTRIKNNNTLIYDKTFDNIIIYNDTQCTGLLDINKANEWFDTESGVNVRDSWFVNAIFDIVKNDKLSFMDAVGNLVDSNLDINKDWFDKSYFISKYCFIKFIYNNESVNGVSLDFVFNSYNINAVKCLR